MKKIAFLLASLLLWTGAAVAQPSPPPGPFRQNGSVIAPATDTACLDMPSTVTGGCRGAGTINATGVYVNGVPVGMSTLLNGQMFVGNLSNMATGVTPSGDWTITSGGVSSVTNLSHVTNASLPLTGIAGLGTGVATFLGTPSSANLAAAVTNETGTGALVFGTGPTFIAPLLGTPASGIGTNLTGLTLAGHAAQAANTVVGNGTSSSASPTALAVPSCSTVSSALTWTSGTGFGCNSISGAGTVTSVSVSSANGFAGTVATATTTPAITISTSITGLLKGNGTAVSAATAGTDYAPATSGSSLLTGNGSGGFTNVTAVPNGTTATTQAANDNSTKVGTTAYADRVATNINVNRQVFTSTGTNTFTPTKTGTYKITLTGGGGAGGAAAAGFAGGGGGGGEGAKCIAWVTLTAGTGYSFFINGAGASTAAAIGATTYTAGGGSAGSAGASANGGAGGTATNGDINDAGADGAPGAPGDGANFGGAGGNGGNGGAGSPAAATATPGVAARVFGGGGGGGANGGAGGAGKQGIAIIEWVG